MGAAKYIKESFRKTMKARSEDYRKRMTEWAKEGVVCRLSDPTNPVRAREVGYKAKKGYCIARVKVMRGKRRRRSADLGRKPGRNRKTENPGENLQLIAEQKAERKFKNLIVLNSYMVGSTGANKFFEVILVDPQRPEIKNDSRINWICSGKHERRAQRALTSAGNKSRGLVKKAK